MRLAEVTRPRILFLIPGRGGSKGLPAKNLASLAGIPLVGRAVRLALGASAQASGECQVVCSTDAPDIADAALAWGAEVPFMRPPQLATDRARSIDVVLHALDALPQEFDTVVVVQATSPLTEREDILAALDLHRLTGCPVVSVFEAQHPVEWLFRLDEEQRLVPVLALGDVYQRQQSLPVYVPNGAIYVASPAQIQGQGFWTAETRGLLMPPERSVDIDTAADLEVARALLAARPIAHVEIAGRKIGSGFPCFVIAEAGVNHNGSLELALKLVDAAAVAGADAVKFQTFVAERLVTVTAAKAAYQARNTGTDGSQLEMLKALELSPEAHATLIAHCRQRGILFLSSPFEEESSDFLDALGVTAFKVPSGELTNLPLLRHLARKGRPLIVSTGMATLAEVDEAVEALRGAGCRKIILLHCVSQYPADPQDSNLRAMATMREAFGVPVGFSDHARDSTVAIVAVALGACVLEKHFTLDRALPGPDHRASVEPEELTALVRAVRSAEQALGDGRKEPKSCETETARTARKSLVAAKVIAMGATLTADMVEIKRPGTGLPPKRMAMLLGRRARLEIPSGVLLGEEMFD